ncbi:MAG: hypothetical protein ACTH6N_04570 [Brachybacterium tyrofermentans]|uniref:hypothetical protein n=1 Tax=Brachybacterium tyrofermentans TaxID=47848 RepID=UPI0018679293|nr:hypothetical protein [Brachybacterium tyrofermentans]
MASTSILPLQLGQAILGRALEPDAPAPEYVQIDGECWKLVTDPAAIQAAQDALEAREKANEAFAMAQYAPRIANRPPVAADAEGKAPGAGWLEYDPATQLLKQMWRWTGQAWEELPMDPVMIPIIQIGTGTAGDLTADRLIVTNEFVARVAQILELSVENLVVTEGATINELVALSIASATAEFQTAYIQNLRTNGAVIDEAVIGELAANLITSGLFRTADEGQRLEIDSNGMVMIGLDADGIEYEMVRIGPSGDNLITLGDTTISPAGVQAPSGAFDELAVGGDDLSTILAALPRGVRAWGQIRQSSDYDSTVDVPRRRAELQTTLQKDRTYRIRISDRYLQHSGTATTYVTDALHYSWDGTPIFPEAPVAGSAQANSGRHYLPAGTFYTAPPMEFIVTTGGYVDNRTFWVMYSITCHNAGTPVRLYAANNFPVTMTVEDLGPAQDGILKRWNEGNGGGGSTPTPDPEPVIKRYTNTYSSNGFRTYDNNGNLRSDPDVVQGLYAGGPSRLLRKGGWTFPSMTGDLAGATIEKVEVYMYMNHSNYYAGATVNVCWWGGVMKDNLNVIGTITGWKRNTGKWINVNSSYFNGFKSGSIAGIGVKPTNSFAEQYARFNGSGAKIRITYTKAS